MESSQSQEPQPTPNESAPAPLHVTKKGKKKPLIITLIAITVLTLGAIGGWLLWGSQQSTDNTKNATDLPGGNIQQKVLTPHTIAYAYNDGDQQAPSDFFWRPAGGGDRQTVPIKAFVNSSRVFENQILVDTYYSGSEAPSILYSKDSGKTYTTIFTGKKPLDGTSFGDQITSLQFASDGKSVVFALLASDGKNTVKRIFFDTPTDVADVMTSTSRGVFIEALNVSTKQLIYSEGCYNCDGNLSPSILAYDLSSKKTKTLVDGADKHLSIHANKAGSKLLIVKPTVDKNRSEEGLVGYYIGAPYAIALFDTTTGASQELAAALGTATDGKPVYAGFMLDGTSAYYYSDTKLFQLGKDSPSLLYESTQPIHNAFYVSPETVIVSVGTYENYKLNRFTVATKETEQILLGDDSSTRIFGVTEN